MCCAFYSELVKGFKERAIIGPCVELIAKRTIFENSERVCEPGAPRASSSTEIFQG